MLFAVKALFLTLEGICEVGIAQVKGMDLSLQSYSFDAGLCHLGKNQNKTLHLPSPISCSLDIVLILI